MEITEENLDVATIQEIGIGGHYLDHPKTFQLCRSEYFQNELFCHESHAAWKKNGSRRIDAVARETVKQRLSGYQAPDIDPGTKKSLTAYVNRRKGL
jgi:trimethylamine--corrinoid protein Co-methyltransferase